MVVMAATGMKSGVLGKAVVERDRGAPAAPVHGVRGCGLYNVNCLVPGVRKPAGLPSGPIGIASERAMFRLMNAAVHFITEAIVDTQSGGGLPGVLKIEVVSLAADGGCVKFTSDRDTHSYTRDAAADLTPKEVKFERSRVRREAYNFYFRTPGRPPPELSVNYGSVMKVNKPHS